MTESRRATTTRDYIVAHWPLVAVLYLALLLSLAVVGGGLALGWYALVPLALAVLLSTVYLLTTFLWTGRQLYAGRGGTPIDVLMRFGQLRPDDNIVYIDLGLRKDALPIARRLTSGKLTAVDIYNPQSNPSTSLRRARARAPRMPPDPRLSWIDGSAGLIPLPDNSASTIFLNLILSEFWLPEEQVLLLRELHRVSAANGRLLAAERVRTQSGLLMSGFFGMAYPSAAHWRRMLQLAGFEVQRELEVNGVVQCYLAQKPTDERAEQLTLGLNYYD